MNDRVNRVDLACLGHVRFGGDIGSAERDIAGLGSELFLGSFSSPKDD